MSLDNKSPSSAPAAGKKSGGTAFIGASIKIKGDISGQEDLVIDGTVEGTVNFRENDVTIGSAGQVNASVHARNICVEGEIKGELRGGEQVTIKPSGQVDGDIRAPRVILDDGCRFKGSVDMDDKSISSDSPRNVSSRLSATGPLSVTGSNRLSQKR